MESISRPVQRNFPRKRSNSNISSKNAYDDVFSGPRKFAAPTFSSRVEDYAEIFGTSRASSIPVLDLDDDNAGLSDFRNSTSSDYSSIFAGFDVGISYDELFAKPETSSSPKTRTHAATKSPNQNSDISGSLEQNQSLDPVKQFNMSYHKTSQKVKDDTKVTTHVAELRAVPGFTCFIDETAALDKNEDDKQKSSAINDVRQKMDFGTTTSPPPKKQSKRGFVRSRNGSSWDGTYSNAKLFKNKHEVHLKSQPSKSAEINGYFKKSTTADFEKETPRTETRDCPPDSSDEELDVNSAAAASVTALRKAIEKAQESIRIAKELMDHQKEGARVLVVKGCSKSSLKVKDRMENGIAPRRNRTHEENEEMCKNMHVSDAAENCEVATRFCEVVDNRKHRRAVSAFEQVDRNEYQEMQEGTTQKEEVVEAAEVKEDKDREESVFKISEHQEENSNKIESSFVVHKLEELGKPEVLEVEETEEKGNSSEVKVEELMETIEDEEFFESQDWDDKDQEEKVNRSLELVEENEHKQEAVLEQEVVGERIKNAEIEEIEESNEQVVVKRLEEAFKWVENEIRLREVVDSYSNELKQKDECVGEIIETEAEEEKETAENIQNKDIKTDENEGTQVDEHRQNDASDLKESEENTSARKLEAKETVVEGAFGYEGDENVVQKECDEIEESEENGEIGVNEESPTTGNDGEESEENLKVKIENSGTEENDEVNVVLEEEKEKEEALHSNRVSNASNSSTSTTLEEEADKHEINEINDIVKVSVSDAEFIENSSFESSTESEIGENQAEHNTEESELASDLECGSDILVNDLRESDAIIKEYGEEIKTRNEDKTKNEESNGKSLAMEEKEKDNTVGESKEEKDNTASASKEEEDRVMKEANKREKEQEKKDRLAVERAIREARERAFTEAKERAERAAVEKVNAEIRKRVMAEARDKLEKAPSSSSSSSSSYQKASQDAKLKAERAAVERATLEARKRALEKALSQKNSSEAQPQQVPDSDSQGNGGTNSESYLRSKAKLEKNQRIMQRAAKALAEKNQRDLLAQKEQAERNRLSESLDADIKRWSSGKEGNLRALLSTLQYILGPASGWQPVSLTDIITASAVKKAYRRATLYVHPDKLQQRGATIPQKYICEKVFDLLKAAWNKFNAEER